MLLKNLISSADGFVYLLSSSIFFHGITANQFHIFSQGIPGIKATRNDTIKDTGISTKINSNQWKRLKQSPYHHERIT